MNILNTIKDRRSIRSFTNDKVNSDLILEIIEASKFAPTWNHFQIIRYNIVEDEKLIDKIADEALLGFNHNIGIVKGSKGLVVMSHVKDKSGIFPGIQKSGSEWEMFDAGCTAQTFSLAAHEMGVGTVILGAFDQDKLADIISLPKEEVVSTIIPYGYAADKPSAPPRKSVSEIARIL